MQQGVLALVVLAVGVFATSTYGYDFSTAKSYASNVIEKASTEPLDRSGGWQVQCFNDGRVPHPTDCGQYILFLLCDSIREAHVQQCPPGLHFSPQTKRCESPCVAQCDHTISCQWKSAAAENSTQSLASVSCVKDGFYRNPENCETYVQCSSGNKYLKSCPKSLHFSEETGTCEHPCQARCNISLAENCGWHLKQTPDNDLDVCRQRPYHGPPCDVYVSRWYFDVAQGICKKFLYGGCNNNNGNIFKTEKECSMKCLRSKTDSVKQPKPNFICVRDGLFKNEEDYGTYIQCSKGKSYIMPCPFGFFFNQVSQTCELLCDAHPEVCPWKASFDDNEKSPKYPKYAAPQEYDCVKDGLYPNPESCATYVRCLDGKALVMDCPEHQHFSQETQSCEKACDAHCDPTVGAECGWELREFAVVKENFICIKAGLHPNPEDCGTYVQCSNGQGYVMPCPKGLHFSHETLRCEAPCDSRCNATLAYQCGWEDGTYTMKKPEYDNLCVRGAGVYRNPQDCESYVQCSGGEAYATPCPRGQHFSELSLKCVNPCDAYCDTRLGEQCGWEMRSYSLKQPLFDFVCLHNGLFENQGDCGTFIQCTGGNPYLISCNFGLHFNPTTQRCEHPCAAGCQPGIEQKCKEDPRYRQYYTIVRRSGANLQSQTYHSYRCMEDGTYPDTRDCTQFIQCSGGMSYVMHCPGGLHYSKETKRCDAPCDAHCDATLAARCGWEHKDHELRKPQYDFLCGTEGPKPDLDGDCTTYIHCCERLAYLGTCSEGLHFNRKSLQCEDPCEAGCDPSLHDICSWDQTEEVPVSTPGQQPKQEENVCQKEGLQHNPRDCGSYVLCYGQRPYVRPCSEGRHFNRRTLECQDPCKARCDLSLADECGWDENETTEAENREWGEFVTTEVFPIPDQQPKFEKNVCKHKGRNPNPRDCRSFLFCSNNGRIYEISCGDGLHYNDSASECQQPCEARCDPAIVEKCERGETVPFGEKTDFSVCKDEDPLNNRYRPHDVDCNAYIDCNYNNKFYCSNGLHFNRSTARCEEPCSARCDPTLAEECGWDESEIPVVTERIKPWWNGDICQWNGNNPNPRNCGSYIFCYNSGQNVHILSCDDGYHFNSSTLQCEHPCEARCDPAIVEKCERGETVHAEDKTDYRAICYRDRFYPRDKRRQPDPEDCNAWIDCAYRSRYYCLYDLHFNRNTERCEEPCSARCDPTLAEECGWYKTEAPEEVSTPKQEVCQKEGIETDCYSYVLCDRKRPNVFSCFHGRHFNRSTLQCQHRCEARCDPSLAEECGWDETETTGEIPVSTPGQQPTFQENVCQKDNYLYRQHNPADCYSYLICWGNQAILQTCGNGLHFNRSTVKCQDPCEARCDPSLAEKCGWDQTVTLKT